jgi:hypothetical protein
MQNRCGGQHRSGAHNMWKSLKMLVNAVVAYAGQG